MIDNKKVQNNIEAEARKKARESGHLIGCTQGGCVMACPIHQSNVRHRDAKRLAAVRVDQPIDTEGKTLGQVKQDMIDHLEGCLATTSRKYLQLDMERQELKDDNETLKTQVIDLNNDLAKSRQEHIAQVSELREAYEKRRKEINGLESYNAELMDSMSEETNAHTATKKAYAQLKREQFPENDKHFVSKEIQRQMISTIEGDLRRLKVHCESYKDEIAKLNQELAGHEVLHNIHVERAEKTKQYLDESRQYKTDAERFNGLYQTYRRDYEALQVKSSEQIRDLDGKWRGCLEILQEQEQELTQAVHKCARLSMLLEHKGPALEAENADLRKWKVDLINQNLILKDKIKCIQSAFDKYEPDRAELEKRNLATIARLEAKLDRAVSNFRSALDGNESKLRLIEDLEAKLATEKECLEKAHDKVRAKEDYQKEFSAKIRSLDERRHAANRVINELKTKIETVEGRHNADRNAAKEQLECYAMMDRRVQSPTGAQGVVTGYRVLQLPDFDKPISYLCLDTTDDGINPWYYLSNVKEI